MKFTLLCLAMCLALSLVSALDNKTAGKNINRPKFDVFGPRQRRSPNDGVKGGGTRVHPLFYFPSKRPAELDVRKGEYICGDKVCKLKAGEVPKNCHGVCQYPINVPNK